MNVIINFFSWLNKKPIEKKEIDKSLESNWNTCKHFMNESKISGKKFLEHPISRKKLLVPSLILSMVSVFQVANPIATYAFIPEGDPKNKDKGNSTNQCDNIPSPSNDGKDDETIANLLIANGATEISNQQPEPENQTDEAGKNAVQEMKNLFEEYYEAGYNKSGDLKRRFLNKLKEKDPEGNNILHLFAKFGKNKNDLPRYIRNFDSYFHNQGLIDRYEKLLEKNKRGFTPRMVAIKNNNLTFLKFFGFWESYDKVIFDQSRNEMTYAFKESTEDFVTEFFSNQCKYLLGKRSFEKNNNPLSATCADDDGNTLLHISVNRKSLNLLKILKNSNEFYSNIKNKDGDTPLNLAVKNNCSDIVAFLIENGADFRITNDAGISPLILANEKNSEQIFKSLLFKVDINEKDKDGNTLLHFAVQNKLINLSFFLINKGANILEENNNGDTPFSLSQTINLKEIETLMRSRIDEDLRNLNQVIKNNSLNELKDLLRNSYILKFIDSVNDDGDTPITCAIQNGAFECLKPLVFKGADLDLANQDGETPLNLAVKKNQPQIVELLIENGADPDLINKDGETLLTLAVKENQIQVIETLLKNSADPYLFDKDGEVPLTLAIKRDQFPIVEILLNYSVDPNTHNRDGETTLALAIKSGQLQIVEALLNNSVDPDFHNNDEETPLTLAIKENQPQIVELLINHDANLNLVNKKGETPLTLAIKENQPQIVELLISYGTDIYMANNNGEYPLDLACQNNMRELFPFEEEDLFEEEENFNSEVCEEEQATEIINPKSEKNSAEEEETNDTKEYEYYSDEEYEPTNYKKTEKKVSPKVIENNNTEEYEYYSDEEEINTSSTKDHEDVFQEEESGDFSEEYEK